MLGTPMNLADSAVSYAAVSKLRGVRKTTLARRARHLISIYTSDFGRDKCLSASPDGSTFDIYTAAFQPRRDNNYRKKNENQFEQLELAAYEPSVWQLIVDQAVQIVRSHSRLGIFLKKTYDVQIS